MTLAIQRDAAVNADVDAIDDLRNSFEAMRDAQIHDPYPSRDERRELLGSLAAMMVGNREPIQEALREDFGVNARCFTDFVEILGVAARASFAADSLDQWMSDDSRPLDPAIFGNGRAFVRPQPKGLVGNIAPWNLPFELAVGPIVEMLAAGNRVILKPSDLAPASAKLLQELIVRAFDPLRVTTAVGGIALARAFSSLPWDHLMYTGSTDIGREVMLAAAQNLTPVTLELGGKCPAIFTESGVTEANIEHILGVKRIKSGQICVSVDHVLVPRARLEEFVTLARQSMASAAPAFSTSADVTGLLTIRHFDRIQEMVEEARSAGSDVIALDADGITDRDERRFPLTLVVDPAPHTRVAREEIFGPILVALPYDDLDEVLDEIAAGDRPLAAYIFGADESQNEHLLARITSGGAAVNAAGWQAALPSMGFGGSGASGMGRHHGVDGFREFSNLRGIFIRGQADHTALLVPPHGPTSQSVVADLYRHVTGSAH
ncbi:aldehyde dehydrogenase family protein [Mycobacterium sp. BMJ-28]